MLTCCELQHGAMHARQAHAARISPSCQDLLSAHECSQQCSGSTSDALLQTGLTQQAVQIQASPSRQPGSLQVLGLQHRLRPWAIPRQVAEQRL